MLVPLSWLREYVSWERSPTELAETLTLAGLEVVAIEQIGDWWDSETIVVGQVEGVYPHPQADRLVLVDVAYGGNAPERVVTGAPNLFEFRNQEDLPRLKVAFARAGAQLVDAYSDERPRPRKKLKPTKIRGVRSTGMVCSELELGLSEEHEGILLLPEDAPVGMPLCAYLRDDILELDLTPDVCRGLSMLGVAREVAALSGRGPLQLPLPNLASQAVDETPHALVDLVIDEPNLCPRYVAAIVEEVEVGESPPWMQQRLSRAGVRPINNIVDITNYVMLETGQPLHAFDYDLLVARAKTAGRNKPLIRVRRARSGETMTTLDGVQRTLASDMLLITDTSGPVAIAGVMGGAETEVTASTRTILLESATFDGINNRVTAQNLRLHSEASHRFTRSIPPTLNPLAAGRAVELMAELAGANYIAPLADVYPKIQETPTVCLTASEVQRQLGMTLSLDEIAAALQQLDIATETILDPTSEPNRFVQYGLSREGKEPVLACQPPWHRLDLTIPADLTEEVARIVGYDQVGYTYMPEEIPLHLPSHELETEERIRDILTGLGLQETIGHSYSSPENHYRLMQHVADREATLEFVELANPYNPEKSVLRRDLLVSALENLTLNLRHSHRLAAFEIGLEFRPDADLAPFPQEQRTLQLVMTGPRYLPYFAQPVSDETFDYFDLKGVLETMFSRLNLDNVSYEATLDDRYGPYCARMLLGERPIGLIGELHPSIRAAYQLPSQTIAIANLAIDPFVSPSWAVRQIDPISPYPAVVEDLAFLVDMETTAQQVLMAIREGGGTALTETKLFDLYQGHPLPETQKSLAFKVTYQSHTHNLNPKDTERIRRKIVQAVAQQTGGELRSA